MLQHTLIVGTTGAGKSYLENAMIDKMMERHDAQFVMLDPKRTELWDYAPADGVDVLKYADTPADFYDAIMYAHTMMMMRFDKMKSKHIKEWDGMPIYVVVDEMGALMNDRRHKKAYAELLGNIGMMGRAAKVFMILCTQVPTRQNVPNEIRDNMTNKVVLRLDDMSRARFVLGSGMSEYIGPLPRYGYGYVKTPDMDRPEKLDTDGIIKALEV